MTLTTFPCYRGFYEGSDDPSGPIPSVKIELIPSKCHGGLCAWEGFVQASGEAGDSCSSQLLCN